jgi:phosphotransferase system IIA component
MTPQLNNAFTLPVHAYGVIVHDDADNLQCPVQGKIQDQIMLFHKRHAITLLFDPSLHSIMFNS